MGTPKLTLFLDVVSPFAYIAFYLTRNSPTFKQCDVKYVPILLGGLMKKCENRPPLEIKNKDKWINLERQRYTSAFGIPCLESGPKPFPQPTVNTGRALCAISKFHPDKLADAFAALYHAFWVEGKTINKPEVISAALSTVLSAETVDEIMGKLSDPAVKKLLTDNTDSAFDEGAFGLPWFVAESAQGKKEAYWGIDHIGMVIDHLGLKRQEEILKSLL